MSTIVNSTTLKARSKGHPVLIITKDTLFSNLCSAKHFLISLLMVVIVPLIALFLLDVKLLNENNTLTEQLGLVHFIYTNGLVFPIIITVSAAPLISEEINSGTMLTLVSKPLRREGIVLGKFIALFLFGSLLSTSSLLILSLAARLIWPFPDVMEFFIVNFIFSIVIIICFGGVTMGLSSMIKKPRNVILFPIIFIIFSFLLGIFIKMLLINPSIDGQSIYEKYQLYHFDLSYHMANIYLSMIDHTVPNAIDAWSTFLVVLGYRKYEAVWVCSPYFALCGLGSIPVVSNYYPPIVSSIILILIGVFMLMGGIFYLKKKDIS
ncbi:MAG: ABC transporter permease [Candidatus Lokiarchaeota archaeon]|nr:ABC transporter permease [Candidatus Lokiarchaeota archaeon]